MSDHENDETTSPGDFDSSVSYTGRVKWFNNKAGYGFVTIVGGDQRTGEDVFVHHSGVKTSSEQYKYLVQGEYVSFTLKESDNATHPFQADNLTGVFGGKLMCETRAEQRQQREEHEGAAGAGGPSAASGDAERGVRGRGRKRGRQSFRLHGAGPRDENSVWTLVREDRGGGGGNRRSRRPHRDNHEEN